MFKFATKSEIAREPEIWSGFREQSSHLVCEEEGQCQSNAQMLINVILTVRCPLSVLCNVLVVLALFLAHQNQI